MLDFETYFDRELAQLTAADGPVSHGFLEVVPGRLRIVGAGRLFVRNICMVFDRFLRAGVPAPPQFSRTV